MCTSKITGETKEEEGITSVKQWASPEKQERNFRQEAMQQIEGGTVHAGDGVTQGRDNVIEYKTQ